MPLKGSHSRYASTRLIAELRERGFNLPDYSAVRKAAFDIDIKVDHYLSSDGPSIHSQASYRAVAQHFGAVAYITGVVDTLEITDDHFSGAALHLELVKTSTAEVLWQHLYTPSFWTWSFTAKGHIKTGMDELAQAVSIFEKEIP